MICWLRERRRRRIAREELPGEQAEWSTPTADQAARWLHVDRHHEPKHPEESGDR